MRDKEIEDIEDLMEWKRRIKKKKWKKKDEGWEWVKGVWKYEIKKKESGNDIFLWRYWNVSRESYVRSGGRENICNEKKIVGDIEIKYSKNDK